MKLKRLLSGLLLVALLVTAWARESSMHARRGEVLTGEREGHPLITFVVVGLGGFRGIVADALWLRGSYLQDRGRFVELVQLAEWITQLEPHSDDVWVFHGWNLAYNVSVMMHRPQDRWRWVESGIELMRDRGISLNPRSAQLHNELGWMFQHKIGSTSDNASPYYRRRFAEQVEAILPNGRLTNIAPETAAQLADTLRMDLSTMLQIENELGWLDWRLPHSHSLYWAWQGAPYAEGFEATRAERMILQSLSATTRRGALDATATPDEKWEYTVKSRMDLLPTVEQRYASVHQRFPDQGFDVALRYFLAAVAQQLHHEGRIIEARAAYQRLVKMLPEEFPTPDYQKVITQSVFLGE